MPPEYIVEELIIPVMGMLTGLGVVATIAWAFVRTGRRPEPSDTARTLSAMDARLTRIEQAVDAISVEVERISEGQRFTTRLVAERLKEPALPPAPGAERR